MKSKKKNDKSIEVLNFQPKDKKKEIKFSKEFENIILNDFQDKPVIIVVVIGLTGQGKSTLLNYLTMKKIGTINRYGKLKDKEERANEIFISKNGDESVLLGANFYSMSLQEFSKMHCPNANINPESNCEILFFDIEGLGGGDVNVTTNTNGLIYLLSLFGIASIVIDLSRDGFYKLDRIEQIKECLILKEAFAEGYKEIDTLKMKYLALYRNRSLYSDKDEEFADKLENDQDKTDFLGKICSNNEKDMTNYLFNNLDKTIDISKINLSLKILPEIKESYNETLLYYKKIVNDISEIIISGQYLLKGHLLINIIKERYMFFIKQLGDIKDDFHSTHEIYRYLLCNKMDAMVDYHISNTKKIIINELEKLKKYAEPSFVDEEFTMLRPKFFLLMKNFNDCKEIEENYFLKLKSGLNEIVNNICEMKNKI